MSPTTANRPVATKTATRISVAVVMLAAVCTLGLAALGLILFWIRS
jgi:hypothetical protein